MAVELKSSKKKKVYNNFEFIISFFFFLFFFSCFYTFFFYYFGSDTKKGKSEELQRHFYSYIYLSIYLFSCLFDDTIRCVPIIFFFLPMYHVSIHVNLNQNQMIHIFISSCCQVIYPFVLYTRHFRFLY